MSSFAQIAQKTELLVHDVWQSKALELVRSGAIDCIIMAHTSALPDQFEQQHLADETMVLAMHPSHPLAKRGSIRFDELDLVSYVDRLRCEFRDSFFEEIKNREINLQVVLRSEREDLVSQSVSNAIGVTTMPQSAAEYAGLQTCTVDDMPLARSISVVTVKDRELHPTVHQFIDHVLAAYRHS